MDLRDSLNQFYYDATVNDLRQLSRTGGGELSYNSMMYLDVISFQNEEGRCTVSSLAEILRVSRSAVTLKVNELVKLGLVEKRRSEEDRRVVYLDVCDVVREALGAYDPPFDRAVRLVEGVYPPEEIETFCRILQTFRGEFLKGF